MRMSHVTHMNESRHMYGIHGCSMTATRRYALSICCQVCCCSWVRRAAAAISLAPRVCCCSSACRVAAAITLTHELYGFILWNVPPSNRFPFNIGSPWTSLPLQYHFPSNITNWIESKGHEHEIGVYFLFPFFWNGFLQLRLPLQYHFPLIITSCIESRHRKVTSTRG